MQTIKFFQMKRLSNILVTSGHISKAFLPSVSSAKRLTYAPITPRTKYGGIYTVTSIAGDGHGPKMMKFVHDAFRAVQAPVDFEKILLDSNHLDDGSLDLAVKSIKRNGVALKGNVFTEQDMQSRNVLLRSRLDLFANVLHCRSHSGIKTKHEKVDIVLVRQNTEGEYSNLEHSAVPGVVESLKVVTRERSTEIARFAFDLCSRMSRKKVTSVHKMDAMPLSDGLFLDACLDVARDYPHIEFEPMFVDTCCLKLVSYPQQFDVLLLSNLYGNILNNVACGLIGGAGVVPGVNFGSDCVVFEVGSRSSDIKLESPLAMLNAGVELLRYLKLDSEADVVERSVNMALRWDKVLPPDLGGDSDALSVMDCVLNHIYSTVGH